jgi:hypothetical protein
MNKQLYTKNGYVSMQLARIFFGMSKGERIPTIADFCERFQTGRGTIQAAFKRMEDQGAIHLESRGHQGSYLLDMDLMKLWELTGMQTLMGTMPLPYSKRYEGLATGLYSAFEERALPFHLAYMRGASNRLQGLLNQRYDFAVVSRFSAEKAIEANKEFAIVQNFGAKSYLGAHVLLFTDHEVTEIQDGMTVGVDPESIDQWEMTLQACEGKKVTLVKLPYSQILNKLQNGKIDTCIFNSDEIMDRYIQIKQVPLNESNDNKSTEAVIVIRKDNTDIFQNLFKLIDIGLIQKIQTQVMNEEILPKY